MNSSPLCPECGKPLPAGSDHCPACLMAQAMASRTLDGDSGKSVPRPPPEPEEIADQFPQFEILECLGRGGMGVVYKARQKALDRIVAIKILAGEWQDDPGFAGRFEKEAKLLAKLNHPNIVTIHDFGNAGGLFHIVMEFIDGVNVRDLLRDGKMAPEQALAIVPPICNALQFAHDHGIVHRDIKPENILLDREGRVKIADFGIATLAGDAADRSGTPAYMAPEQEARAARIDHRADIYALGVVLYEMLTGERPTTSPVAPSKQVQIDVRLDEVVLRALESRPELRFQQASEIRTRVETIMDRRPAALLKSQEGCLSLYTPGGERMPYPWKGGLSLYDDRLVISTKTVPHEIPLAAIRAIGMAVMPVWFSPAGHRYLSVDFEQAGMPGHLVFLPIEGNFGLPATAERRTQDWLHILGQAVQAATGRSLPEPSPLPSTIPINPLISLVWLLPLAMVVFGVLMIGFVMFGMMSARSVPEPPGETFWLVALRTTAKLAPWAALILGPALVVFFSLARRSKRPWEPENTLSKFVFGTLLLGLLGTPLLLSFARSDEGVLIFGGACLLASLGLGIASWRTRIGRIVTVIWCVVGMVVLATAAMFSSRNKAAVAEARSRMNVARRMAAPAAAKPVQRVSILVRNDGRATVNREMVTAEDMDAVLMRIAGIDRATLVTIHTLPETPAGILEALLQKCVRAGLTDIKVMSPESHERR